MKERELVKRETSNHEGGEGELPTKGRSSWRGVESMDDGEETRKEARGNTVASFCGIEPERGGLGEVGDGKERLATRVNGSTRGKSGFFRDICAANGSSKRAGESGIERQRIERRPAT